MCVCGSRGSGWRGIEGVCRQGVVLTAARCEEARTGSIRVSRFHPPHMPPHTHLPTHPSTFPCVSRRRYGARCAARSMTTASAWWRATHAASGSTPAAATSQTTTRSRRALCVLRAWPRAGPPRGASGVRRLLRWVMLGRQRLPRGPACHTAEGQDAKAPGIHALAARRPPHALAAIGRRRPPTSPACHTAEGRAKAPGRYVFGWLPRKMEKRC